MVQGHVPRSTSLCFSMKSDSNLGSSHLQLTELAITLERPICPSWASGGEDTKTRSPDSDISHRSNQRTRPPSPAAVNPLQYRHHLADGDYIHYLFAISGATPGDLWLPLVL